MLLYEFQKAVYAALSANASLVAKAGVYDFVPEGKDLPFVVIGDDTAEEFNTKTFTGREITTDVVVWSSDRGCLLAKELLGYVEASLATDLSSGGYNYDFHKLGSLRVEKLNTEQNEVLVRGQISLVYRVEV